MRAQKPWRAGTVHIVGAYMYSELACKLGTSASLTTTALQWNINYHLTTFLELRTTTTFLSSQTTHAVCTRQAISYAKKSLRFPKLLLDVGYGAECRLSCEAHCSFFGATAGMCRLRAHTPSHTPWSLQTLVLPSIIIDVDTSSASEPRATPILLAAADLSTVIDWVDKLMQPSL